MKIILLISGLLFSGGLFANTDEICLVYAKTYADEERVIKRCDRDNILEFRNIDSQSSLLSNIAKWCRHDREINHFFNEQRGYQFSCVLYSNKPRY
jgi:hypothetical protein